jgi:hypothetical protein
LSGSASSGCFFLDATIILSDILKENTPRIDKFKNDVDFHSITCYISGSVRQECNTKIETTLNFIGTVIRDSVKVGLEESRRNRDIPINSPITSEDILELEKLFSALHSAARITQQVPLLSPIGIVEEWSVAFLGEKLEQGEAIDISQFSLELVKKILSLSSSIEDPYDELVTFERKYAKNVDVTVDNPIVSSLRRMDVHEPDATHIASAISHLTNTQEKTVFVTFDYSTIIRQQDEIKRFLNIVCCDPLYAIYHLSS